MIAWMAAGAFGGAFVLSLLATRLARSVAPRLGMIDVPGRHKSHARPVALLGGSAILASVLGPSLLAIAVARVWSSVGMPSWLPAGMHDYVRGAAAKGGEALVLLSGAIVLHAMGLRDDRRALGPVLKLAVEVAVAAAVVGLCPDVRVVQFAGPPASIAASVFWIVAITNAFNFMDNMDGLSAGVAAVCAAALLAAAISMGQMFVSAWLCLLLGALLGFLPHNFHPARIFMGDAGSLVVGYFLAVLSALTTYVKPGGISYLYSVLAPVVLMAVPIYDMASVIFLRLRSGASPFVGDRRHFSHRLVRRGMGVRAATVTIYLCTAGTAIAASLLPHVADATGALLVFGQTMCILAMIALLESGAK